MTVKSRFAFLEKRRPTLEMPIAQVSRRFETLGEDVRATPPSPAYTVPVREAVQEPGATAETAGTVTAPPRDNDRDRFLALLLLAIFGPRLARTIGQLASTLLVLMLLVFFLGFGVLGRGCRALSGDYGAPAAHKAPRPPARVPADPSHVLDGP